MTQDASLPVPETGGTELAQLGRSINTMLASLAAARDHERRLIDDAAHELRTPLTSLRTNIEMLTDARPLDAADRVELLADLRSQMEEFTTLVGDLDALARGDGDPSQMDAEPVALDAVVLAAVRRAQRRAGSITLHTTIDEPASVDRHRDDARARRPQHPRQRREMVAPGRHGRRGPLRRGDHRHRHRAGHLRARSAARLRPVLAGTVVEIDPWLGPGTGDRPSDRRRARRAGHHRTPRHGRNVRAVDVADDRGRSTRPDDTGSGSMNDWLWYLTRASGIVATVLIVAALAWGFLFSARETGNRLRPAWWLDLHNWLGGMALVFTGVHLLAVFADSDLGLGLVDILVPEHRVGADGRGHMGRRCVLSARRSGVHVVAEASVQAAGVAGGAPVVRAGNHLRRPPRLSDRLRCERNCVQGIPRRARRPGRVPGGPSPVRARPPESRPLAEQFREFSRDGLTASYPGRAHCSHGTRPPRPDRRTCRLGRSPRRPATGPTRGPPHPDAAAPARRPGAIERRPDRARHPAGAGVGMPPKAAGPSPSPSAW